MMPSTWGGPQPESTRFTETMRGWFSPFEGQKFSAAEASGRAAGRSGYFVLTVISDVAAMIADPDRRSPAFGCVILPPLGPGPLRVADGWLDLFVDAAPNIVEMRYGLKLQNSAGAAYYLRGVKEIVRRSWFPTVLQDTTTLFVDVFAGEAPVGDPLLRGILRMDVAAVNAQGLSFRGEGTWFGLAAIGRFMAYYLTRVRTVYFGPRALPRIER